MSEQNKATARRIFEAWEKRDFDVFDELISPDAVDHDEQNPFKDDRGPSVIKQVAGMYMDGFPDTHFEIGAQYADGDFVITRWSVTGTNTGGMMGMPATGKSIEITGIGIDRFEDGLIAETWGNWDTLGMMQQLGVVPEAQPA